MATTTTQPLSRTRTLRGHHDPAPPRPNPLHRAAAIMLALLILAPAIAGPPADWPHERWFVVQMLGEKAGWMHTQRSIDENGNLVSAERMQFSLGRMGQDITIRVESRFVETPEHRPVEILSIMDLGASPTESRYRFSDDGTRITETTRRGDAAPRTREIPRPAGSWMTPAQVAQFVAKRLEAQADSIAYATLESSTSLQVILVRSKIIERTTVEAMGKRVPALRVESTTSLMPELTMISYIDEHGEDIRSSVNLGAITMEIIASEREVALSPFKAPEMMATTVVHPIGELPDARSSRRASFILRLTGDNPDARMPDLIDSGGQRVTRIDPRAVQIDIDLDNPITLTDPQRLANDDPRTLGSSTMIDLEDPALRATLAQALEGVPEHADRATRAEAIRRFVFEFIDNKNLGVGFATASETCRTREGDCSEHATLLAALLRLDGIPARTVSGLVYVDQFAQEQRVFGFHMWTQALLQTEPDEQGQPRWTWVDLDAAISPIHPTDAARIAVVTSTLDDADTINSMVDIAVLMGQLSIEVR